MRDKFIEISLNDLIAKDIIYQHDKGQVVRFVEEIGDGTLVLFNNSNIKEDAVPRYVENCSVEIPDRLLETEGSLIVTVKLVDSNSETTQKVVKIKIKSGSKQNDEIAPENQQTFIEQIQEIMTTTKSIAEDVQERADNGEFDGKDGADGRDGKSAYEIAVEGGYEGTEEEWIESLNGTDGYSPSATVLKTDGKTTVSITDKDGTTNVEIIDGEDGYSPTVTAEKVENKTVLKVTDKYGTKETEINDGVVPVYNEQTGYVEFKNALNIDSLVNMIYGGES